MHTEYEKPVCEVLAIEIEEGIMSVSGDDAPINPNMDSSGSSLEEKNFWSR